MSRLWFLLVCLCLSLDLLAADLSIDSMKSKEFSVGIFWFLIFSIFVFVVITFIHMLKGKSKLKLGEKIMFIWILLGVVAAVVFGASQLLHGFLF